MWCICEKGAPARYSSYNVARRVVGSLSFGVAAAASRRDAIRLFFEQRRLNL